MSNRSEISALIMDLEGARACGDADRIAEIDKQILDLNTNPVKATGEGVFDLPAPS